MVHPEHGALERLRGLDTAAARAAARRRSRGGDRTVPAVAAPLLCRLLLIHRMPSPSPRMQAAAVLFCIMSLVTFGDLLQIQYDENAGSPGSQARVALHGVQAHMLRLAGCRRLQHASAG